MITIAKEVRKRWPWHVVRDTEPEEIVYTVRPTLRDGFRLDDPNCPVSGAITRGEPEQVRTGRYRQLTLCGVEVQIGQGWGRWETNIVQKYNPDLTCGNCIKSYKAKEGK